MNYRIKEEYNELCPNTIVELFLNTKNYWFTDRENGMYNKRDKIRKYLLSYIEDNNTNDFGDIVLIVAECSFREFMEMFEEINNIDEE